MTATVTVDIPALKRRYQLGDMVEASGVKLRGRGRVRQGKCPFHKETEGSFTVYADTQRFYCFGCGLGGDVLDFIQRTDGVDLPEAIRRLERAPPPQPQAAAPATRQPASAEPLPAVRDPALLTAAMRCYQRQLQLSETAQAYLASRGISPGAARRLGLGYASGAGLRDWLAQAGFGDRRILSSGLVRQQRERFGGMVVVPELIGGRVLWLAGRSIWSDVSPRFQALPGPKANARPAPAGPSGPLDRRYRGIVRLARADRLGPARLRGARRPGDGQAGFLPTGTTARLPRLRRGRRGTRSGGRARRTPQRSPRRDRGPARRRRRRGRAGRSPGRPRPLPRPAQASGAGRSLATPLPAGHFPLPPNTPIKQRNGGPASGL